MDAARSGERAGSGPSVSARLDLVRRSRRPTGPRRRTRRVEGPDAHGDLGPPMDPGVLGPIGNVRSHRAHAPVLGIAGLPLDFEAGLVVRVVAPVRVRYVRTSAPERARPH